VWFQDTACIVEGRKSDERVLKAAAQGVWENTLSSRDPSPPVTVWCWFQVIAGQPSAVPAGNLPSAPHRWARWLLSTNVHNASP